MTATAEIAHAIAALESQRALLGNDVVDAALSGLRSRLAGHQTAASSALPALDQVRKQVSILFLDVVGSTALGLHLDPEEIHTVMDGCLHRCTGVVQAHGGRVLQYAGDNLLAAFGADQAQEDDAERAVRCGLALLEEGHVLAEAVLHRYGVQGSQVRVGIHTGAVLLGGGVDGAGTIRGLAVNMAARMEQSAPPGALRISQDTWLLVRGLFDAQPQPPLLVKGSDQPVATWLVQRVRPRAFQLPQRGIEGLRTPLLGREAELAQLLDCVAASAATQSLHAATLLADPGLGKSRLLQEVQRLLPTCETPTRLLLGRAHPQSPLQAYGLLRDLVLGWARVSDSDSAGQAVAQLNDTLTPLLPEGGNGPQAIGRLLGLNYPDHPLWQGIDPRQARELGFAALAHALHGLARRDGMTLVLMLEDLQWADDGSLDFLQQMLAGGLLSDGEADAPLALMLTARPALLERRSSWAQATTGQSTHQLVRLQAMGGDATLALAQSLTQRVQPPDSALAVQNLLCQRAEGNPFYMEELLKMLLDEGILRAEGADWQLQAQRLRIDALPTTLVGVLQARLDALKPAEKRALQQASIVGHVFWDEALAALDPQAPAAVPGLRQRQLVLSQGSSVFDGTQEEVFHHHLLHEVTYDTVLKATRRQGHARAAAWLAARVGQRSPEYLAITAEHYSRAGDNDQARGFFEQAASSAQARFANTAVIALAQRALDLPDDSDATRLAAAQPTPGSVGYERRVRLLLMQEEAADLAGMPDAAERANDELAALAALASALGDDSLHTRVIINRARQATRRGQDQHALTLGLQALALAAARTDPLHAVHAVNACFRIAHCRYIAGEVEQCEADIQTGLDWVAKALPQHDSPGLRQEELQLLNYQAALAIAQNDLPAALRRSEAALERAQALGSQRMEGIVRNTLAGTQACLGLTALALRNLERTVVLARALNFPLLEAFALYNRAACQRIDRHHADALATVEDAAALCSRIQANQHGGRCAMLRCSLLHDQGRYADALNALTQAGQFFAEDDAPYRCQLRARRARALWAAGDRDQALRLADEVAAMLDGGVLLGGTEEPVLPVAVCAELWLANGDARAAAQVAQVQKLLLDELAKLTDTTDRSRMIATVQPFCDFVPTLTALGAQLVL